MDAIIGAFADRHNSFLMLSTRELTPDTVVDITHESVIRKWRQLKNWVREESRSAEWYADLARDVVRYRSKAASLWQDPELAGVEQRRRDDAWNEAWAEQYQTHRRSGLFRGAVVSRPERSRTGGAPA